MTSEGGGSGRSQIVMPQMISDNTSAAEAVRSQINQALGRAAHRAAMRVVRDAEKSLSSGSCTKGA